jgi:hypothetical protein
MIKFKEISDEKEKLANEDNLSISQFVNVGDVVSIRPSLEENPWNLI